MKYINLIAFEKHLEGSIPDHFASIYMILAKEVYSRQSAAELLSKYILPNKQSRSLSLQTYDGEQHSVDLIIQELNTLTFFTKIRLIIVHNADAFDKTAIAKFENYFENPNQSVVLGLVATAINRATNFYKKAEKIGIILDIADEKPWEKEKIVADWLFSEARKHQKQMEFNTCQMLIKQVGTDQILLSTELQKLICYVGDRPSIHERDVVAICTRVNLDNGWQLAEAVFCRNTSNAVKICRSMLIEGVAFIALLRQIRAQFQTGYQICSILIQGGHAADVSKEYPYMKGSILDKNMRQAKEYGMPRFKQGLLVIDKTENEAKQTGADVDFLADMLILKLTS